MKVPKKQKNFRLSEEIQVTLQVLSEMTGENMTHILEECIRPGKKTYAKQRGLDYKTVIENISLTRMAIDEKRKKEAEDHLSNSPQPNVTEEMITDSDRMRHQIKIAKTKWLTNEED